MAHVVAHSSTRHAVQLREPAWGVAGTVMEKTRAALRSAHAQPRDRAARAAGRIQPGGLVPESLTNMATLYRKATAGDENVGIPGAVDRPNRRLLREAAVSPPGKTTPSAERTLLGPQGGLRASARDRAHHGHAV